MKQFTTLTPLLEPRSVAILGASNDPRRIGGRVLGYLLERQFQGQLYPMSRSRAEVQGVPAYEAVSALPECPDVAILALAAPLVPEAIADLVERGVKGAVIFSSGFAEAGPAGADLQRQALAAAGSMRLLGPNTLGLFNARCNFWGTFTNSFEAGWPLPGRVGIASQSGAYGAHMLSVARNRGIGNSIFVATGNEADINVADAIGWMAEDDGTDVIVSYIEGLSDGARLIAALDAARIARKPVIMMKAGRSRLGSLAVQSHTASLAGDDAVADAVLRELGVVRVGNTQQALDIALAATKRIYPVPNRLGVLSISGGVGILIADEADALGVPMPELPASAQARIQEKLSFAAPRNPVDCTAQTLNQLELVGDFGLEMVASGGFTSLLIYFGPAGGVASVVPRLREELRRIRATAPEMLCVFSVIATPDVVAQYEEDGYLVYDEPSRAMLAIAAMGQLGRAFASRRPAQPPALPALSPPTGAMTNEAAAKRFLSEAGIAVATERRCGTAAEAIAAAGGMGFPVVMKILSPDVMHKTEVGGVMTDIRDTNAVADGYDRLLRNLRAARPDARLDGVLVARQVVGGVECVMGIQRDPAFGPIALFGLGGIHVELLRDTVLRRCPFGPEEALAMIEAIRGYPLLAGARGQPAVKLDALAAMLSRLSVLGSAMGPDLAGIDLNPVIATPEGAWAVDAVIQLDGRGRASPG